LKSRAAREGLTLKTAGKVIGKITSGAFSPSLAHAIAMGYVQADEKLQTGDIIEIAAGRNH